VLVAWHGTGRDLPGFRPLARRPMMWILTTVGALSLFAVAMVAVTVAYRGRVGDLVIVEHGRAFALALVVIVGTEFLVIGLLLAALRGVTLDPPRARRSR
jgi:hypothetical protein